MARNPTLRRTTPRIMLAAAIFAIIAAASCAFGAAASYPADEIEAAFLYRFAGFVSWPPQALGPATFTIAVLDDTAVAADLGRMLSHGQLKGRQVQIRNITSIDAVGDAQILYIRAGEASTLRGRLAPLTGRHVLIVTSEPGGLAAGSTINFLLLERHVRFEISLVAARRAGLSISADLLSVATHIEGHPIGSEAPCGFSPLPQRPAPLCLPQLAAR